jgi:hypothetical protein
MPRLSGARPSVCQSQFKVHEISMSIDRKVGEVGVLEWRARVIDQAFCFEFIFYAFTVMGVCMCVCVCVRVCVCVCWGGMVCTIGLFIEFVVQYVQCSVDAGG